MLSFLKNWELQLVCKLTRLSMHQLSIINVSLAPLFNCLLFLFLDVYLLISILYASIICMPFTKLNYMESIQHGTQNMWMLSNHYHGVMYATHRINRVQTLSFTHFLSIENFEHPCLINNGIIIELPLFIAMIEVNLCILASKQLYSNKLFIDKDTNRYAIVSHHNNL